MERAELVTLIGWVHENDKKSFSSLAFVSPLFVALAKSRLVLLAIFVFCLARQRWPEPSKATASASLACRVELDQWLAQLDTQMASKR